MSFVLFIHSFIQLVSGTGIKIQGFMLAGQALYYLSHAPSLFFFL
jgi:hypothetical protein